MGKLGLLVNLDLLSVGISVAGICILGFAVFFNNRKSSTNRTFLAFSVSAFFWSVSNYLLYQFQQPELILLTTRLHMLFSVLYSFLIFRLFFVFPTEKVKLPKIYRSIILPVVVITALLTLTPLVLSQVTDNSTGEVAVISPGPGIILFGIVVISLIISGIVILSKKMKRAEKKDRAAFKFIITGVSITFSLHIVFNFLMPIVFKNPRFVPFGAVFTFPFVALTSYAIFRHYLLNVKVITTEIFAFILTVATLFEVVLSKDTTTLIFRSGIFLLVLGFSILLIKSVLREVEQREQLQKLTEELQVANKKLDELNKFKSDMLSLASHDIKRPLATIKGFASILIDGLYGPVTDKMKETLIKMKNSTDDLVTLVESLLNLRRVEEGYKFEPTKLNDLITGVVGDLKQAAAEKKIELSFTPEADLSTNADPQKLKEAIKNIIDNALKYTPAGSVKVGLKEENGYAVISVIDSGLGIPQNLLPRLFGEEFVRDERFKHEIRGTGLGLYLTGKIIAAHAGKVWAESAGEGKGSSFYIKLRKV